MRESISSMNANHAATAQAGQLVSLAACREQKIAEVSFSDNLDYLQALEQEGKLILANALLRQRGADWQNNPNYVRAISIAALSPTETKPEKLAELISFLEQRNCVRAEAAEQSGVIIYFIKFCRDKKLEGFSKTVILLLLLLATSKRFIEMFDLCDFGDNARKGSNVKIDTILNIICPDLREQLSSRKYFSIDYPLMQHDILCMERRNDDNSSVFERYVGIHDRYVRYIVGDNNLYESTTGLIRRDTASTVRLDQVIVPDETKKELVSRIGNHLSYRENNEADILDDFYGYGTALTILFHGPSGTGKTMMVQALASHFKRPLYSLKSNLSKMDRILFVDDAIKNLFLEASLNSGIVFIDEADDLFEKDTYASHLLLIEIEKARCVVILSTNKTVDLDPALDRRLSLKVYFGIPEVELRYRMWQALMPDFVKLAPDVDFKVLAERYQFTGGLIKNIICLMLNSTLMSGNNGNSIVTMEMIKQAAEVQLRQMVDMSKLYQIKSPQCKINDLPINLEQRDELRNAAKAYRNLQEQNLGLNIFVTCTDAQTGIKVVEALAQECNLKIKIFDYMDIYLKNSRDDKVLDPITQKRMYPMDFAFTESTGDNSLLLFVDSAGVVNWARNMKKEEDDDNKRIFPHIDMLRHLRSYQGLFCMVTVHPHRGVLPAEFSIHFHMEYPPEETQMQQWEKHFVKNKISDDELVSLVENNPMHVAEIDFIVRQATIQSIIKSSSGGLTIRNINSVIARYRPKRSTALLFGRS